MKAIVFNIQVFFTTSTVLKIGEHHLDIPQVKLRRMNEWMKTLLLCQVDLAEGTLKINLKS